MSVFVQASPPKPAEPEIVRRSSNYHPCVWGDHFLAYNTPEHATPDEDTLQKIQVLKDEVKKMLLEAASQPQQQLKLIADIQRLGLAYHFQVEIDAALQRMNDAYHELCKVTNMQNDLHFVALCFRLLRQHCYNVSSDVFNKFKDESTGKFKESLNKDVEGLLSLYEATHLRVHGEDILEEALAFTTSHLESLKTQLKDPLAAQVIRALKIPLWKSVNRVEARHCISLYGEDDSHSKTLFYFAKLDYNLLQKLYQSELGKISSWWMNLHMKEKMPFARDRVVESYFWALGTSFEPQYALSRSFLTKTLALLVVVDDMYDVYGTVEELTLFTDAMLQRWDINALDRLPEYMRHIYRVLLDFDTEVEEELSKAGMPVSRAQYGKEAMKQIIRSYIFEAKCVNKWIAPTMDEYMPYSLIGTTIPILAIYFMVGMGDIVTTEALEWASTFPSILRASSLYCRLTDDMVEDKAGKAEDTAYVVGCYMRQHGVSKEYTYSEFRKQNTQAWKDMNSECLQPTAVPLPILRVALSSSRLVYISYECQDNDGFTSSDTKTKELIGTLLVNPIPI
ncbi:Vetispiradiene synthase 1 [Heracleum sosnowskyi]|uniref:Vetispiradiene synthase 1 n=1 Tax=Heracleum sosnowskyi TaxID=360622 RepID=A0AAD8JCS5_9APIA|nr:Vetispiradiene synthase 1 [Heracleum sosnowskyi]